jgi:hypothetical protein
MTDPSAHVRRRQFSLIALVGLTVAAAVCFWLASDPTGLMVLRLAGYMSVAAGGVLAMLGISMWLHRLIWRLGGVVEDER